MSFIEEMRKITKDVQDAKKADAEQAFKTFVEEKVYPVIRKSAEEGKTSTGPFDLPRDYELKKVINHLHREGFTADRYGDAAFSNMLTVSW